MSDKTKQIRVSLPTDLVVLLQQKADRLGLSVSAYLKFLMIADVKDDPLLHNPPRVNQS